MKTNRNWKLAVILSVLAVSVAYGLQPLRAETLRPTVTGDIQSECGFYSVVFYYSEKAPADALAILKNLADKAMPWIPVVSNATPKTQTPFIGFEEEEAPLKRLPVPEAPYFKFAGRGLSEADIATVQKTPKATEIFLIVPAKDVWKWSRIFTELALNYAEATHAYLWDSATRECFTAKAWKEIRLDSWPVEEVIPDLKKQITIHLYRPDDNSQYLRAVTLGMEKFALPDISIEQLIGSDNFSAGSLINLSCQFLAENPTVGDGRVFEMDVLKIKNQKVSKHFQEGYLSGATGKIRLALLQGNRQEGDTDNSLLELGFGNYEGKNTDEKREMALAELWGSSDSIKGVKHDDEILAASEQAKKRLPELRKMMLAGLKTGERILLKAPFQRDDEGNEWMWVEVMDWKEEGQVKGILQNDPFYIKSLKAGAAVTIQVPDVFDYILYKGDGTEEGNETGKIIEKREGEVRSKDRS